VKIPAAVFGDFLAEISAETLHPENDEDLRKQIKIPVHRVLVDAQLAAQFVV
jgi:hypothetical protein